MYYKTGLYVNRISSELSLHWIDLLHCTGFMFTIDNGKDKSSVINFRNSSKISVNIAYSENQDEQGERAFSHILYIELLGNKRSSDALAGCVFRSFYYSEQSLWQQHDERIVLRCKKIEGGVSTYLARLFHENFQPSEQIGATSYVFPPNLSPPDYMGLLTYGKCKLKIFSGSCLDLSKQNELPSSCHEYVSINFYRGDDRVITSSLEDVSQILMSSGIGFQRLTAG